MLQIKKIKINTDFSQTIICHKLKHLFLNEITINFKSLILILKYRQKYLQQLHLMYSRLKIDSNWKW